MQKAFKHPLARRATTTGVRRADGGEEIVLVIVTTLELETNAKGYSAKNVNRLHHAAQAYLNEVSGLAGYAIINRPKDWDA